MSTLRQKYIPSENRAVIMNLFQVPLNVLVVLVFLNIKRLGTGGALGVAALALAFGGVGSRALQREEKIERMRILEEERSGR